MRERTVLINRRMTLNDVSCFYHDVGDDIYVEFNIEDRPYRMCVEPQDDAANIQEKLDRALDFFERPCTIRFKDFERSRAALELDALIKESRSYDI